jgi:hypothetical protein
MMYRFGGALKIDGMLFETCIVNSEADQLKAEHAGWSGLNEAKSAAAPVIKEDALRSVVLDTKPPEAAAPITRESMIADAEKLGIKIDKRWGDDRLMAEITKAMGDLPAQ